MAGVSGFDAAELRAKAETSGGVSVIWKEEPRTLVCRKVGGAKELFVGGEIVQPVEAVNAWREVIVLGIVKLLSGEAPG